MVVFDVFFYFVFILICFYLLSGCRLVANCLICFLKDYEISAPLQRSLFWGSSVTQECAVYEPSPRVTHAPSQAAPQVIQRGTWKTGSTSSTSSKPPFTSGFGFPFKTEETQVSAHSLGHFISNLFELHLFNWYFACSLRITSDCLLSICFNSYGQLPALRSYCFYVTLHRSFLIFRAGEGT